MNIADCITVYRCKWCSRTFTKSKEFVRHKKHEHPDEFAEQIRAKKERENLEGKNKIHVQNVNVKLTTIPLRDPREDRSEGGGSETSTERANSPSVHEEIKSFPSIIPSQKIGVSSSTSPTNWKNPSPSLETKVIKDSVKVPNVSPNDENLVKKDIVVDWESTGIEKQIPTPSPDASSREGVISDSTATEILTEDPQPQHEEETKRTLHKCKVCRMIFSDRDRLLLHEQRHPKLTTKGVISTSSSTNNNSSRKKKSAFTCRFCKKRLSSASSQRDHENLWHTKIKPHKCDFCEEVFATTSQKVRHTKKFHESPSTCSAADFACVKEFFLHHQRAPSNIITSNNPDTTTTTTTTTKVNSSHMSNYSSIHETPKKKIIKSYKEVEEPMDQSNSPTIISPTSFQYVTKRMIRGKPMFVCEFCQQEFTTEYMAIEHLPKHTRERNYPCKWCSKTYLYDRDIKKHERLFHADKIKAQLRVKYSQPPKPKSFSTTTAATTKISGKIKGVIRGRGRRVSKGLSVSRAEIMKSHSLTVDSHWTEFYYRRSTDKSNIRVCKICKRGFAGDTVPEDHVNVHTGMKPYKCRFCDSVFGFKRNKVSHERTKHAMGQDKESPVNRKGTGTNWEPYDPSTIRESSDTFSEEENDNNNDDHQHDLSSLSGEEDRVNQNLSEYVVSQPFNGKEVHVCSFCKHIFPSLSIALTHVEKAHTGEKIPSIQIPSSSSSNLDKNSKTNPGESSFTCAICHKSFAYASTLKRHMYSHVDFSQEDEQGEEEESQEQEYEPQKRRNHGIVKTQTSKRRKTTATATTTTSLLKKRRARGTLTSHSFEFITVKGRGRYSCNFCQKISTTSANAMRHVRIHTGERPFVCSDEECGKAYSDSSALHKHMLTHTRPKLFCCPICSDEFDLKSKLNSHIKIHPELQHKEFTPRISNVFSLSMDCEDPGIQNQFGDTASPPVDEDGLELGEVRVPTFNEGFRRGYVVGDGQADNKLEVKFGGGVAGSDGANPLAIFDYDSGDWEQDEKQVEGRRCVSPEGRPGRKPQNLISNLSTQHPGPAVNFLVQKENSKGLTMYFCTFCDKEFKFPSHAERHVRTHTGERPWVCSFPNCVRAFIDNYELRRHQKNAGHLGEGEVEDERITFSSFVDGSGGNQPNTTNSSCSESDKNDNSQESEDDISFDVHDQSSLYVSTAMENDSLVYRCNFCRKGYDRITYAVCHSRIHTGETPYKCRTCLKEFSYGSSLRRHRNTVHAKKS